MIAPGTTILKKNVIGAINSDTQQQRALIPKKGPIKLMKSGKLMGTANDQEDFQLLDSSSYFSEIGGLNSTGIVTLPQPVDSDVKPERKFSMSKILSVASKGGSKDESIMRASHSSNIYQRLSSQNQTQMEQKQPMTPVVGDSQKKSAATIVKLKKRVSPIKKVETQQPK